MKLHDLACTDMDSAGCIFLLPSLYCALMMLLTERWLQVSLTAFLTATSAHRLLRLLAAVCAVGLLGGFAVGVWFLGESVCCRLVSCHQRVETYRNCSKKLLQCTALRAFHFTAISYES